MKLKELKTIFAGQLNSNAAYRPLTKERFKEKYTKASRMRVAESHVEELADRYLESQKKLVSRIGFKKLFYLIRVNENPELTKYNQIWEDELDTFKDNLEFIEYMRDTNIPKFKTNKEKRDK